MLPAVLQIAATCNSVAFINDYSAMLTLGGIIMVTMPVLLIRHQACPARFACLSAATAAAHGPPRAAWHASPQRLQRMACLTTYTD